ncbi:PTS sugar transporter subunit IIA [Tessaracoccus sp. Z1128]
MQITAPCAGRVIAMRDVPDPVFSAQTVGPGVGIEPGDGRQSVVSPAAGRLLKVSPHAFIVLAGDDLGILVHIGINTVRLAGEGFDLLARQGDEVAAGSPVVSWDPGAVTDPDMSRTVVVAVMDGAPDSVTDAAVGRDVAAGDALFSC